MKHFKVKKMKCEKRDIEKTNTSDGYTIPVINPVKPLQDKNCIHEKSNVTWSVVLHAK